MEVRVLSLALIYCYEQDGKMAKEKKNSLENLNFEQAIDKLSQIVSKIEQGDINLESSIEEYEQGMSLIKHCRQILRAAEQRIEQINTDTDKPEPAPDK